MGLMDCKEERQKEESRRCALCLTVLCSAELCFSRKGGEWVTCWLERLCLLPVLTPDCYTSSFTWTRLHSIYNATVGCMDCQSLCRFQWKNSRLLIDYVIIGKRHITLLVFFMSTRCIFMNGNKYLLLIYVALKRKMWSGDELWMHHSESWEHL